MTVFAVDNEMTFFVTSFFQTKKYFLKISESFVVEKSVILSLS